MEPKDIALTEQDALARMDAACAALPEYPGGFSGRGIVIPAGGERFFTCAWVCVHMLRRLGCRLPIQFWHLGPAEMSEEMRALVTPLGVECVDAREVSRRCPARILNGWEVKWFAIAHCRFEQVLLLDADNVPVVDPELLFESGPYDEHGAVFWPDRGRLAPSHPVWRLTGVAYRGEPEFETGQIVVDKARCWGPLRLAGWMNDHSDFWYRCFHGDKETFHLAWRKLGRGYAMPIHAIEDREGVICQHDFEGRRIFQHRSGHKWTLMGDNRRIAGLLFEDECRAALDELDRAWQGRRMRRYRDETAAAGQRERARALCAGRWTYWRIGYDERAMAFGLDGRVTQGAAGCERTWSFDGDALCLNGENELTCRLEPAGPGRWTGPWLIHQRMPIELIDEAEMARLGPKARRLGPRDAGAGERTFSVAGAMGERTRSPVGPATDLGHHGQAGTLAHGTRQMGPLVENDHAPGADKWLIYSTNAGYFDMLRVSIASFIRHNGDGDWAIVVLDVGLAAWQRRVLGRMNVDVRIYPAHHAQIAPGLTYPAAWSRLRMLEDFTADGATLLYLDADSLVLSSVEPMVAEFLASEQAIGLATEIGDTQWPPPKMGGAFAAGALPQFPRYEQWKDHLVMNTGVLLARGPAAAEVGRHCTDLYPSLSEGALWAEQSILNAVLLDRGYTWWEMPQHFHCMVRAESIEHAGPIYEGGATYRGRKVVVRHFCGGGQKDAYARDVLPKAREFFGV